MRNVLIISPRFPPVNAADMHRVRQSLPYFREMGWAPHVLAVDPAYVHRTRDDLLLDTIPADVRVDHVPALSTEWTRLVRIGSLALRSLFFYLRTGNRLLRQRDIDLVYFSTTAFPVMVLGWYWKAQYGVPYVIDMHDPWRPDYYLDEPPSERPPKFWLAYAMHGCLESIAMSGVDGIISVSQGYCDTLTERYDGISPSDCTVIPFGAPENDFSVLEGADLTNPFFDPSNDAINVVYVGRGGHDMAPAAHGLFGALARGLDEAPERFGKIQMYFVGTSYAEEGEGEKTFAPIAAAHGVEDHVTEQPARVPYFQALHLMREADMLVVPGSDDPNYTASKLYPYILSRTPLLAVFNRQSSVIDVLHETGAGRVISFSGDTAEETLSSRVLETWGSMLRRLPYTPDTDWEAFEPYTARETTRRQVEVFDRVVR
jgi:hypothetical protein